MSAQPRTSRSAERVSAQGRAEMRRALASVLPLAEALGSPDLLDAANTCLAMLDAPGPLDKKTLLPVMKSIHERVAELFRRGAEETKGKLRETLVQGAQQADEEAAWMAEMLAEMADEPS